MKIKNKFIILLTIFIVFYINVITKNEKIDILTYTVIRYTVFFNADIREVLYEAK